MSSSVGPRLVGEVNELVEPAIERERPGDSSSFGHSTSRDFVGIQSDTLVGTHQPFPRVWPEHLYLAPTVKIQGRNVLWGAMQQTAALFGPIVEVRDVLESFLHDQVLVVDWRQRLTRASQQFVELGVGSPDEDVAELGGRIAVLAEAELAKEPTLTRSVAADVEKLLDQVRVPELPRPEDDDWSF